MGIITSFSLPPFESVKQELIRYFEAGNSLELYFRFGNGAISNSEIKNFVNLIVIDPPYNELPKDLDEFNDWNLLNNEFDRVLKKNGQIYIFGKQPMLSNIYNEFKDIFDFRFELVWSKGKGLWTTNHAPMRSHELIWCFKKKETKV